MGEREPLSPAARAELRAIARSAVERAVHGRDERPGASAGSTAGNARATARPPAAAPSVSAELARPAGAFVTLKLRGRLRGCIGHITPDDAVSAVVAASARAAAIDDPRFAPVSRAELGAIDLEVSVLGPLCPVGGPAEIEVGRDGLVVKKGRRSGLLLPQVATEHGFDRESFLEETCVKAGLPRDAWRDGAEIYTFSAEVF